MTSGVDSMSAGPEMDALVAEYVMGWKPNVRHPNHPNLRGDGWWSMPNGGEAGFTAVLPEFSMDASAAVEVWKKVARKRYDMRTL